MADLPIELPDPGLTAQLARAIDIEGKIARAFEALGPMADRDVVLLDGARGLRARQLAALGARLTVLERPAEFPSLAAALDAEVMLDADLARVVVAIGEPRATGLPDTSADALVACWSAYRGPDALELAEADRVLRPGGRLLVLHDYGRDDVSRLLGADRPEYTSWSRRNSPFLRGGFRIRVIHCWWTFASLEEARGLLCDGFGPAGAELAASLARPRLSYNVAIYHRSRLDALAA